MSFNGDELDDAELDKRLMIFECRKENAANLKLEGRILHRWYLEAVAEYKAKYPGQYPKILDMVSEPNLDESDIHHRQIGELDIYVGMPRFRRYQRFEEGEIPVSFPDLEEEYSI